MESKELTNAIAAAVRDGFESLRHTITESRDVEPLLVSLSTAARMLEVSPRSVEALIDEGVLRAKIVRRKLRVSVKSLRAYADRC